MQPRRTQGGYRLFSEGDLERLEKILRLQRDEFLPLRVIKDELDAGGAAERKRRRPASLGAAEDEIRFEELCERAGIAPELAKELEDFGLIAPTAPVGQSGTRNRTSMSRRPASQLGRYGMEPRNLRTFRTATGRQAALLEQLVAPALRGRNPERRTQALRDLQRLAELAGELSALLFWRDLRDLAQ